MGRVENILAEVNSSIERLSFGRAEADELRKGLGYFKENIDLMRYAQFRLAGYFIGAGVVEAGAEPSSENVSSETACFGACEEPTL